MPYVTLLCDEQSEAIIAPLSYYFSLSGINLQMDREKPESALFCVRRSIVSKTLLLYPPQAGSYRLAQRVFSLLRQANIDTTLSVNERLPHYSVPSVQLRLSAGLKDLDAIARVISCACAGLFHLPELPQRPERPAKTVVEASTALRSMPALSAAVLHKIPPDDTLSVLGSEKDWSIVRHREELGFVHTSRIRALF